MYGLKGKHRRCGSFRGRQWPVITWHAKLRQAIFKYKVWYLEHSWNQLWAWQSFRKLNMCRIEELCVSLLPANGIAGNSGVACNTAPTYQRRRSNGNFKKHQTEIKFDATFQLWIALPRFQLFHVEWHLLHLYYFGYFKLAGVKSNQISWNSPLWKTCFMKS